MSDRFEKVININAPLLQQRAQIVRQRVGDAALSSVPTLHCTQRDVEIACKRIEDAYAQPDMFVETPTKPVQEPLL